MSPRTDSALSLNDELTALLTRMRPRIKHLFKSFEIPAVDAEDLLQEALLSLMRCWQTVGDPEAWLFGTLRYLCYGYLRRERYGTRTVCFDSSYIEEVILLPDTRAQERRDQKLDVEALVTALPASRRKMLRLRYIAGLSYEEVGRQLGCTKAAVNRGITRSVKFLNQRSSK